MASLEGLPGAVVKQFSFQKSWSDLEELTLKRVFHSHRKISGETPEVRSDKGKKEEREAREESERKKEFPVDAIAISNIRNYQSITDSLTDRGLYTRIYARRCYRI